MRRLASRFYGQGFTEGKGYLPRTQGDERTTGCVTTQGIALLVLGEGDKALFIDLATLFVFDGVLAP
ncbi:hypothetical protein [Nitrospira sp. Nam74]